MTSALWARSGPAVIAVREASERFGQELKPVAEDLGAFVPLRVNLALGCWSGCRAVALVDHQIDLVALGQKQGLVVDRDTPIRRHARHANAGVCRAIAEEFVEVTDFSFSPARLS